MYRSIETSTWDDPKVMDLPSEAKLLFVYLFSNRHGHLSGIYYLPDATILLELGAKRDRVCRYPIGVLWDTLSGAGLAWRDPKLQMVFVKNMFQYQGQGEKHYKHAAAHLKTLHKTPLIARFIERYPRIKRYGIEAETIGYTDRVSDRVSGSGKSGHTGTGTGTGDKNTNCAQQADAPSDDSVFTELPCSGKRPVFLVHRSYIKEMKPLFPKVDVETEILRAKGWLLNNPRRRKTHRGVTRFLGAWLSKEQDDGKKSLPAKDTVGQDERYANMTEEEIRQREAERQKATDEFFGITEDE